MKKTSSVLTTVIITVFIAGVIGLYSFMIFPLAGVTVLGAGILALFLLGLFIALCNVFWQRMKEIKKENADDYRNY